MKKKELACRIVNGITQRWLWVLQRGERIAKKLLTPFKPPSSRL